MLFTTLFMFSDPTVSCAAIYAMQLSKDGPKSISEVSIMINSITPGIEIIITNDEPTTLSKELVGDRPIISITSTTDFIKLGNIPSGSVVVIHT